MALSGLDIYKLLPKTNCKQCGYATCLAFAMALAKKAVDIDKCPFLSEEAKRILESSSLPPIRLVTIGFGDTKLEVGNETVMFRHEEKFHRPCGSSIRGAASRIRHRTGPPLPANPEVARGWE